ncbi:unnamed protein product [Coregonus sp. 'balchen']|nr:unnamed protein product [Coregonus sp. 'balchen']
MLRENRYEEEHCLDFKSLRAKYQDEEVLLKQPRTKPALPLKPKVLSPPHSPTNSLPSFSPTSHTPSNSHALPPGARPSLLSSLQGKGGFAPRVIFEEKEKKLKGKDLLDQKQKIEADLVMKNKKVSLLSPRGSNRGSVELVDASPPPINATEKKKGFRGIRKPVKSGKKGKEGKGEFPPLPMLDIASPDMAGPEPLIALTTFRTPSHPANIPIPTALIPPAPAAHIARLPPAPIPAPVLDARLTPELLPSTLMPAPAAETITVVTPPDPPTLEVETPAETIPAPTLAVLVPPSPTPSPVPAPPSPVPTPPVTPNPSAIPTPRPPTIATPSPPAIPTLPPPTIATPRRPVIATPPQPADPTPSPPPPPPTPTPPAPEPESVVVDAAVVVEASASTSPSHTPPPPAVDPPVTHPSPQPERPVLVQERPLSALSALGRAEEMIPQKKRGSEIIFNALEKAKRKFARYTVYL